MAFQLSFRSSFLKDLKKLCRKDKSRKAKIKAEVEKILADPLNFEALKGNLRGAYKHKFGRKPEMRIVFTVVICSGDQCKLNHPQSDSHIWNECSGVVSLIWVKSREEISNMYNKSKKELGDFLDVAPESND